MTSPYFKDLYLCVAQNKLPTKRNTIHKVEALVEKFILLHSLLFKLVITTDGEMALLAIPEIWIDKIITLYHSSLFAGHQNKNTPYNRRKVLYPRSYTLFMIIHKRVPHLPASKKTQATDKVIAN